MRTINRDIRNPPFLLVFTASSLLLAAAIALSTARIWDEDSPLLRLAGGSLFVLGNFVLTVAYHVPRNDKLDQSPEYW